MEKIITPCNPNALPCVRRLMEYLGPWCGGFFLTEDHTTAQALRAMYDHPWAITKDRLPELY